MKSVAANSFTDNIKMLSHHLIKPHNNNFYSMSEIELLAEDIERQGLKSNLVVREDNNNGTYIIISGHRRHKALELLIEQGRAASHLIPCYINPAKSEDDELHDLIMLNATSRVISDSEMIEQYEKLKSIFEKKKASGENIRMRDTIAEVLGVSTGQVSKIENVVKNAVPEVKKAVKDGKMSLHTANEVTKKPLPLMATNKPKPGALPLMATDKSKPGALSLMTTSEPKSDVLPLMATICPHCGKEIKGE
jgi:ParB family chromosome partitioning protein